MVHSQRKLWAAFFIPSFFFSDCKMVQTGWLTVILNTIDPSLFFIPCSLCRPNLPFTEIIFIQLFKAQYLNHSMDSILLLSELIQIHILYQSSWNLPLFPRFNQASQCSPTHLRLQVLTFLPITPMFLGYLVLHLAWRSFLSKDHFCSSQSDKNSFPPTLC